MSEAATGPTAREAPAASAVPSGRVLAVLLSAMFLGQFDFFVVNVAAPSLQHDLGATEGELELIVGAYAFAYAAGLITGGRLGDLVGYRRLFVVGMLAFAVTSLLCGLVVTPVQLILARLGQGLAAAAMLPQVLALITASYPPAIRPRALAWYGVAAGLGSIAGQVFGGLLVAGDAAGLGWRLIFLVNVPVCLVAAILAARMLPVPEITRRPGLDIIGAAGIAFALALLLVPLTLGRSSGWPVWTWISLVASVPVAAAALRWQQFKGRRGGTPILDLALLRNPTFRVGLLANTAFMLFFASFMFTLTLLLQHGLGLGPFSAGLCFAPAGVAYAASALAARPLLARHGNRVILVGCAIIIAGLLLLIARLSADGAATAPAWVVVSAALMSLGNGLVLPSLIGAALINVASHQAGAASGVLSTAQQFGGSAGIALVGTAYFAAVSLRPGPAGYAGAINWSAAIQLVLILAVATSIILIDRAGRPAR